MDTIVPYCQQKMKIGFNCRFLHTARVTGVERYARNLLESLVEAGQEEEFVLFGCKGCPPSLPAHRNISLVGSCAFPSAAVKQVWEQTVLPVIAGRSKVDLLINPVNTAPVLFGRNVMVIHDLAFLEHPEWFDRKFVRFYTNIVPRAAGKARAIITISEFSKDRIVRLLKAPDEKVHVVYQGVDPAFHPVSEDEVERTLAKFKLKRPYVLFVGSITPRKNLQSAIKAFKLLSAKSAMTHTMAVVGVNSYQFPKEEVSNEDADGIRAVGYADDTDLPGLYTGADVLVYPSLYEGFGLPPLEAMACGTPVVTSDRTSLPEAVGDAALTVNPDDIAALSDAVGRIISDNKLAADLKTRGLEHVKQFTWQNTAKQALDVIKRTKG